MSSPLDFDRRLTDWLDSDAPMREPDGLSYAVLARTRRMRQVPRWASLERWIPMTVIARPALAPPLRVAWLLLIALLALSLAAGGAIVGSRLLRSSGPDQGLPAAALIPQGPDAVLAFASIEEDGGDIYTVRADGAEMRHLTDGSGIESHPVWSPDGTRIAHRLFEDGADSLVVTDAGGENRTILATDGQPSQDCLALWSVAWSPDGSSLVFPTRDSCEGRHVLNIVAADGSTPATVLLATELNGLYPAWSPDGASIAFLGTEAAGGVGLYVADIGPEGALGGGLLARLVGPELEPALSESPSVPSWSPDGTEIAVVVGRTADFFITPDDRVVAVKADGSGQRTVAEYGGKPSWSPDGRHVAFYRRVEPTEYWKDRPCTVRTWIVDFDGTNERRLDGLGEGCDFGPLWSPDGTRISSLLIDTSYEGPDENPFRLSVVTVDGSSPLVTLPDAGWASWQRVIPAG